jgi:type I restriction enzyme R subunit
MPFSEADTRAKLIDPAIHSRGWTEDFIRREETAGAIEIIDGKPRKQAKGRVDYVLRVKVTPDSQPVAVALIEAKAENLPPTHGLEQVKAYGACKRLNVKFVYSSNGHLFVEYDFITGQTSKPRPLNKFPSPADLRQRYETAVGFSLNDPAAQPLLVRYPGGRSNPALLPGRRHSSRAGKDRSLSKHRRAKARVALSCHAKCVPYVPRLDTDDVLWHSVRTWMPRWWCAVEFFRTRL